MTRSICSPEILASLLEQSRARIIQLEAALDSIERLTRGYDTIRLQNVNFICRINRQEPQAQEFAPGP
jgi:hypothetical protein